MNNNCWNEIGVWGDRSCGELTTVIHCHHCPVYSAAGRNLLERETSADYLKEWTQLLATEKDVKALGTISVTIFRLGGEWLALPTKLFQEITPVSQVRRLPHRSNEILGGVVNVRGEILLCIKLDRLLGIEMESDRAVHPTQGILSKRMMVVEKEGDRWVFAVDEIYGIHRFHPNEMQSLPTTVSKARDTYSKGIIQWQSKNVALLDDELLFYTLNRRIL